MGNYRGVLLLSILVLCYGISMANGFYYEDHTEREFEPIEGEKRFLLRDSKRVIETDAGYVKVVKSYGGRLIDRPMHIGFITMEPKSLFLPQYLDSSLIIFIRRGEARIGLIYKDELAERRLEIGDVYRIPAGSAFYLINVGEGQRLHVICSIDPSESLGIGPFQSFFVGGGTYPASILAGFESETLSTAFNVTADELREVMGSQRKGPIIYIDDSRAPRIWKSFIKMEEQEKLNHLKKMMPFHNEEEEVEVSTGSFPWRKLLQSILDQKICETKGSLTWRKVLQSVLIGRDKDRKRGETKGKSPDSYNLYKRSPDFRNNYGSSVALDESSYDPLKHSGVGVYLVNLTGGSMMAPHVNPTATEYGIVLRGSGVIQIVYPNGTQAMNAKVAEGDVFMVPRYFPFCQIASRTGPFEFFGYTTSARKNRPQFLAGANSLLTSLRGAELAASFGTTEERLRRFVDAQREAVILPSASAAPPDKIEKKGMEKGYGERATNV